MKSKTVRRLCFVGYILVLIVSWAIGTHWKDWGWVAGWVGGIIATYLRVIRDEFKE